MHGVLWLCGTAAQAGAQGSTVARGLACGALHQPGSWLGACEAECMLRGRGGLRLVRSACRQRAAGLGGVGERCGRVRTRCKEVQFLQDCQTAWNQHFPGWSSDNPDCRTALGISCDSSGMITDINLWSMNLRGSIPDSISNLRKLRFLELSVNQLNGSIPTAIGALTNLSWLTLGINRFSGSIPAAIGNLSKLSWL
ncbi:hypothetical protein CLOM_g16958 [Closterium sp. NIES-68]|nr:hypothetical protein CLOM_g16958 [Closterium sp. NIES-68]